MTPEDIARLQFTITSPGWTDVLVPRLVRERDAAAVALTRTAAERAEPKFNDDFLRGYLRGLILAIESPAAVIREFENQMSRDKDEASGEPEPAGSPYADRP